MKKMYKKPLVFVDNRTNGETVSNSDVYKKKMEEKLKHLKEEITESFSSREKEIHM